MHCVQAVIKLLSRPEERAMLIWSCSCGARTMPVWAPAPSAASSEPAQASAAGPSAVLRRASSPGHPPLLSRPHPAPGSAHRHPLLTHNNALSGTAPDILHVGHHQGPVRARYCMIQHWHETRQTRPASHETAEPTLKVSISAHLALCNGTSRAKAEAAMQLRGHT